MSTIQQVAHAFVAGNKAQCHNAMTDGKAYYLHGHIIARCIPCSDHITYDWCGYYTATTAHHLNAIRDEVKHPVSPTRFSYAWSRDHNDDTGFIS